MPPLSAAIPAPDGTVAVAAPRGGYRWRILALLFFATTVNYMDRSLLTVLAPTLQYKVFHWTDNDYARITMSFQAAYALGLVTMGALIDKLGTKIGYTVSILIWSCFGMLHAAIQPAFGLIGFVLARFGLGFGEAGNYPAAVKTVAEWFPKKERALATGIFNAGSNMGAMLAPICVPLVVSSVDGAHWQFAFLLTGGLSAIWVALWWKYYQRPEAQPALSPAERAYITSDAAVDRHAGDKVKWLKVLPLPETWAFAVAKTTDAAWWFYSFWAGKFFYDQFGLNIKTLALPLIAIYVAADVGSVGGGWFSSHLLKRGWSVNRARKTTLLICALCALPVAFSARLGTRFTITPATLATLRQAPDSAAAADKLQVLDGKSYASAREFLTAVREVIGPADATRLEAPLIAAARSDALYWVAVALISLAAAAHQAWSATIFTIVSDLFPRRATASVAGIGGMVGACAGIVANYSLGSVLMGSGAIGYFYMFLVAGTSYLLALGAIQLLTPRLDPVNLDRLS